MVNNKKGKNKQPQKGEAAAFGEKQEEIKLEID